jgi:hypothetical protein
MNKIKPTDCCPIFEVKPWEEQELIWKEKRFIKDAIPTFFHIPWPPMISKLMEKMWKQLEEAKAAPKAEEFLCLTYDPSNWKSEYYMATTKEVAGAENVSLSESFSPRFLMAIMPTPLNGLKRWRNMWEVKVRRL